MGEVLQGQGQSPWLDYLQRSLIEKGGLRTLIERDGLKGVTSNPSIFEKAIGETDEYSDALKEFQAQADHGISAIYEHLAIADHPAALLSIGAMMRKFRAGFPTLSTVSAKDFGKGALPLRRRLSREIGVGF